MTKVKKAKRIPRCNHSENTPAGEVSFLRVPLVLMKLHLLYSPAPQYILKQCDPRWVLNQFLRLPLMNSEAQLQKISA